MTAEEEIAAVDAALSDATPFANVHVHLAAALEKLSDREARDCCNSVKESISAVEAMVNEIEGRRSTLGAAMKRVGIDAHPALKEASSSSTGIRATPMGSGMRSSRTPTSPRGRRADRRLT